MLQDLLYYIDKLGEIFLALMMAIGGLVLRPLKGGWIALLLIIIMSVALGLIAGDVTDALIGRDDYRQAVVAFVALIARSLIVGILVFFGAFEDDPEQFIINWVKTKRLKK